MRSDLVRRDKASWQHNSWVVGVVNSYSSKAYDWNELLRKKIIEDSVNDMPILLAIENDSASFHVYDRRVDETLLSFQVSGEKDSPGKNSPGNDSPAPKDLLQDINTRSSWNMDGVCIAGPLKGKRLVPVQAYNEFWHSWQTFHQNGKIYVY